MEEKKKVNFKIIIPIVIIIAIVIVAIVGILIYSNSDLSKDYYYFLQSGDYQKAYKKAKNDSEKQEIIQQNAVAYACKIAFNGNISLIIGSKLENAWYDKNKNIVLYLTNEDYSSLNNKTYIYITYKEDTQDYECVCVSRSPVYKDNISLTDKYSSTATNSTYASIGNEIIRQGMANKMNEIMATENIIQSRTIGNVNRYFNLAILDTVELFKPNE